MNKKELSQFGYSQEAGSQLPYNESLLSGKDAEAIPCGLTTKHIHNTCQKKPSWISKELDNQYKRKPLKSLLSNQGEKQKGAL